MKQNQNGNARRSIDWIGKSFDEVAPEERAEAEQELEAVGLDPSTVGENLEQLALKSIRTRVLREQSAAVQARHTQFGVDLTTKLN